MSPSPLRSDETFMREALRLAWQDGGLPYPNPWVGCIVVQKGRIVGRGFHRGPGLNHAEVEALREAAGRSRNATLFVTLEPCCHYGRTPPCTNAIIEAGIRRVVFPFCDPNPAVAGGGARSLKSQGIQITSGVCVKEAKALNEVYLKYRATGLPFVTVKVAASLDGKIATRGGQSQWITDEPARQCARELRARHQAVLVGINTVLADNPHLGPRIRTPHEPWRVVLDSSLRIPLRSRVLQSGRCIVACARAASAQKEEALKRCGAEVWKFQGTRVPIKALLQRLVNNTGIVSVMVEGGSEVLGSFFDANLVDRVYWFIAPIVLGSERSKCAVAGKGVNSLTDAFKLKDVAVRAVGGCWLIRGNVSEWARCGKTQPDETSTARPRGRKQADVLSDLRALKTMINTEHTKALRGLR
jgi:diaminohydroxyphosphoribosylaminopyrimidine deaminase / 5-amino-6-(5-phosphoribosylamino)uracil reductase